MNKSQALRAACLSAAVVTAFGLPAEVEAAAPPEKKPLNLSSTSSLTYLHLRVVSGSISRSTFVVVITDDSLVDGRPGGATTSVEVDFDAASPPTHYMLIAANPATATTPASIMLSMGDGSVGLGRSFASLFPGFDEASVAASFAAGSASSDLNNFVAAAWGIAGVGAQLDSASTLIGFSTGTDIGTAYATFSPIPEPGGAITVLGALGAGVLLRRRGV